jgi:hypothetical protein
VKAVSSGRIPSKSLASSVGRGARNQVSPVPAVRIANSFSFSAIAVTMVLPAVPLAVSAMHLAAAIPTWRKNRSFWLMKASTSLVESDQPFVSMIGP